MENSKYQRARIAIIDRELSKRKMVKSRDLLSIINDELSIPCCLRTVQKDIELMKSDPPIGYNAPIEIDRKNKTYYYSQTFTIKTFGLKEEHINALLFYSRTLHHFQDYKIFKDISAAVEKVLDNFKISPEVRRLVQSGQIVQTEKFPPVKGHELIDRIVEAIEENKFIKFDYSPFGRPSSGRMLAPLLLREDKHLWYVIGFQDGKGKPKTFALDRMSNLKITDKVFTSQKFDPDNYFKHSFGITVPEEQPVEVVLSFSSYQGNYLKALPIHETQKVLIDDENEYRISVRIKPSYEFYSKILSYGPNVKVISPETVVNEVKRLIRESDQKYK
jgi:predicted DNA-binding transcriptional regulator YafY